jgi:anionic cell wall polymer biosynthesis LytR-Cps2A-Psr (LCP) family protein
MQFPKLLRTPVAAALLSAVWPGLGQAAAGQPRRGAIVSIPMFGLAASLLFLAIFERSSLFGLAVNQTWLTSLLLLDLVWVVYHVWAILDAYLVARMGSGPAMRDDRHRRSTVRRTSWAAILGVFLILSGTVVVHAQIASIDMGWQHTLDCLTAINPCQGPIAQGPDSNSSDNPYLPSLDIPDSPGPSGSGSTASVESIAPIQASDLPTFPTTTVSENWAQDGQLNVLLLGVGIGGDNPCPSPNSDLRCRLGPDTLMVVHVDLKSGKAAMISVGRNFICAPLPADMASHFPAGTCPAGQYPAMINSVGSLAWSACAKVPYYPETCGQSRDEMAYRRAMRTFETVIGTLLGITIDGSVTINPTGMTTLIDDLGGIDVTVTSKIYDKPCGPTGSWQQKIGAQVAVPGTSTCADAHNGYSVPTYLSGVQKMRDGAAAAGATIAWQQGQDIAFVMGTGTHHLNGDWAMAYSRTRIYTTDFARQARQQEVLRSLRKGLDPCSLLTRMNSLLGDIGTTFNTDMPITDPSDASAWASLGHNILGNNVKSIVLTPSDLGMPFVGSYPAVDNASWVKIKNLVAHSLDTVPGATSSGGTSGGGGSVC